MSQKKIDLKDEEVTAPEKNNHQIVAVMMILLIFAAGVIIFFYQKNIASQKPNSAVLQTSKVKKTETAQEEKIAKNDVEEEIIDTTYTYENEPAYEGAVFFEELLSIEGQNAYIAHPMTIDKEEPPSIVIYSHGSITNITDDMGSQYMSGFIREYGSFFTDANYIFAASNQHGENWGNQESVNDTKNLIEYVDRKYQTSGRIYMIGFSMGGLPTWEFITTHPKGVEKVALLAPTSYYWNHPKEEIDKLQDMDIMIWHGNIDDSVPLSMSQDMVNHAKKYNKEIKLNILNGKSHWDVDDELKDEILIFFEI